MNRNFFEMKAREYGISSLPEDTTVAMAYFPYQKEYDLNVYSAEQGICKGTMFPDLNKPFMPSKRIGGTQNE